MTFRTMLRLTRPTLALGSPACERGLVGFASNDARLLIATLLAMLGSLTASAQGIERVVVMIDRAEITRSTQLPCLEGRAQAVFEGIPDSADVRTLRGEADSPAKAIGTTSAMVELEVAIAEDARALEQQLEKVMSDIRTRQDRISEIQRRESSLDGLDRVFQAVLSEAVRNPDPDRAAWGRTLDSLSSERRSLSEDRIKLESEILELSREERRLALLLESLGAGGSKRALRVELAIECQGSGQVRARLSYVIAGARWRPEYELRIDPLAKSGLGSAKAELTVGAIVEQSTGEDWTSVSLSLSTAKPKLGSEAPIPAPIYVEGYEEKAGKVLVQSQVQREQLPSGQVGDATQADSVAVDDKGQSFLLSIPHRVTLRSDGRPTWVPVDVAKGDANVSLVTIPKLVPRVYRVAKLTNPAAFPLLEGRVRSYRGDSYMGESRLRHHGLAEPVEISLGVDDSVRVKRERQKHKDEGPGFLGNTKHMRKAYEITLESQAATPITVEVRENIPVSQTEDVEVELLEETTKGATRDDQRGFLTYKADLTPSQTKKLLIVYTIHLPDDWTVQ
ncbi:MAG: mucoidy inhibitor MuiA family protein [Deltaproteobacteria bacterium]|nr:mucoidy inhibitor MuiA family protein [Deltaproteobacteria bacterium]